MLVELERKKLEDTKMSDLDIRYLCISPSEAAVSLMLPLAAVQFSSSLPSLLGGMSSM